MNRWIKRKQIRYCTEFLEQSLRKVALSNQLLCNIVKCNMILTINCHSNNQSEKKLLNLHHTTTPKSQSTDNNTQTSVSCSHLCHFLFYFSQLFFLHIILRLNKLKFFFQMRQNLYSVCDFLAQFQQFLKVILCKSIFCWHVGVLDDEIAISKIDILQRKHIANTL